MKVTKPTYLPGELLPVYADHQARGQWGTKHNIPEMTEPTAVAAIRKAFMRSNVSRDDWASGQRYGRVDGRAAVRIINRQRDVFRRRAATSETKVRLLVLCDASGSMHHEMPGRKRGAPRLSRIEATAIFGATIAKALGKVPTVSIDVYQHTTGGNAAGTASGVRLKHRWAKGTPVAVFNGAAEWGLSGNADGHALMAMADHAVKTAKPGEQVMVLVVSDGLPADYGRGGQANASVALMEAVETLRKRGVKVMGVAIDGSDQTMFYGTDTVPFTGDWTALGKALAKTIGTALAGRSRGR